MLDQSDGDRCRVLLANLRTMAEEMEELLSLGSPTGFGAVRADLQRVADKMEGAVASAAAAAGVVEASKVEEEAAERRRAEAFAAFDFTETRRQLLDQFHGPGWAERKAAERRERAALNAKRRDRKATPDRA